jgi:Kef-type K+ transport system membrane component KefB
MEIFVELSIIIALATLIGGVMRLLKQPLIMGYILTGVVVGPHFLNILKDIESGEIFSLMGISILLFIVGLSLSPHVIREVGKISLITGTGQVMFTTFLGFMIAKGFGYEFIPSLYIAISLAFSSTIIILKLLSDKKDLEKLYGKIAIGFLIVQDIIATLILIGISSFTSGQDILQSALLVLIKGISAAIVLSFISYYLLPKLSDFFAKSQEYLFLFAVGWGFGLASVFKMMGFSAEIGALVAGVTLSMSPYAREISAKLKPLRDFFLIMFFILLGVNMDITSLSGMLVPALIFSTFVLVGNPIIVILLMESSL